MPLLSSHWTCPILDPLLAPVHVQAVCALSVLQGSLDAGSCVRYIKLSREVCTGAGSLYMHSIARHFLCGSCARRYAKLSGEEIRLDRYAKFRKLGMWEEFLVRGGQWREAREAHANVSAPRSALLICHVAEPVCEDLVGSLTRPAVEGWMWQQTDSLP